MPSKASLSAIAFALLTTFASAQQQLLVNGNSQLPQCAQSCALLTQASGACSGEPTEQSAWICFCQSAYLTALRQTAATTCGTECPNTSDQTQLSTWYNSNCGSDNGASEHTGTAAAASSTVAGNAGQQATGTNAAAAATSSSSSSSSSSSNSNAAPGTWWSGHYQWIVMVIVLLILLPAIGFLGHWLKRRHERRRDQNRNGFNSGITTRVGPPDQPDHHASVRNSTIAPSTRRSSPTRTRSAFMPYGYGYNRSDSRQGTASPRPRDGTPDLEKDPMPGTPVADPSKRRSKRVLVRERSGADSIQAEKDNRF